MFSEERLQEMVNDPRPKNPSPKRRPDKVIAGEKLAKMVSEKTGYHFTDVKIIMAEFYKTVIEEINNKNVVEFPGIGSMFPTLKEARATMNFNFHNDKKPEQMLMQPRFSMCFRVSAILDKTLKELPVSEEEIEKIIYSKPKRRKLCK